MGLQLWCLRKETDATFDVLFDRNSYDRKVASFSISYTLILALLLKIKPYYKLKICVADVSYLLKLKTLLQTYFSEHL